MKILYVHGFRSAGEGSSKVSKLREILGDRGEVIAPTLTHENLLIDAQTLILLAKKEKFDLVVGTSLGGLLADYVGSLLNTDVLLINPVVSTDHISDYEGNEYENFKTKNKFIFDPSATTHLDVIQPKGDEADMMGRKTHIALGVWEEQLDFRDAIQFYFKRQNVDIQLYNDDHRFNVEFETALRHVID